MEHVVTQTNFHPRKAAFPEGVTPPYKRFTEYLFLFETGSEAVSSEAWSY
jgi:hypothetical protein